jgi:hypothetical protein
VELEVHTTGNSSDSRQARYDVEHVGGITSIVVDQSSVRGFVSLGEFVFAEGAGQFIKLGDNTGEQGGLGRRVIFDAVRVTPVDDGGCLLVEVETGGGQLNVRPQPNTSQASIGQLANGEVVELLESVTGQSISGDTTWHHVRRGNLDGYVSGVYAQCL